MEIKKKKPKKSQIVPDSPGGSGNTQKPEPPPKKPQIPSRIHHFFTYNNYDSTDINILLKLFDEYCYMYAFQEETGENGTPHLQGIISCKKRQRDTIFGNKKIHWEKPADVKASYIYCTKEETRSGKVFTKNYKIPYTFKIKNLYIWEQKLLNLLLLEPDDRKVFWYWSQEGNKGKSTFVKHMVVNYNAIFLSKGKYSDLINVIYKSDLSSNRIIMIDIPRKNGNKVSYDAIESLKNGLICNTKFETGSYVFPPPHVVIFANCEPEFNDTLSEDRWIIVNID